MYLTPSQSNRVQHVRRQATALWRSEDPLQGAARLLAQLVAAEVTAVYTLGGDGRMAHFVGSDPRAEGAARTAIEGGMYRYTLRGSDRFAAQAVDDRVLYAGDSEGYDGLRRHLRQHDLPLDHTLRVVVQHADQTCGWLGFMRSKSMGAFGVVERSMLQAVTPELESVLAATSFLDASRMRGMSLAAVLEAFDEPAMLCAQHGQLVLANEAARAQYPQTPAWLAEAVARGGVPSVRVTRVWIDDRALSLVVSSELRGGRSAPRTPGTNHEGLPPYLASVVELMLEGCSDQEIADRTGRSYNTVRTYIRRLYARYDVHNRVQLLRAIGQVGATHGPGRAKSSPPEGPSFAPLSRK